MFTWFLSLLMSSVLSTNPLPVPPGEAQAPTPPPGLNDAETALWREAVFGPLPRWREDPLPPLDPNRSLVPYSISLAGPHMAPTSGVVVSPPEFAPTDGVLFRYSTSAWSGVVRDCVASLTGDPAHDEIAYVIVGSASQQSTAASQFAASGADLSKVEFTIMPTDSIWLRDYGPHFIWLSGTRNIVDSHYYPGRPLDNFVPTLVAEDYFGISSFPIGLYYSGGNFQPDGNGNGFKTSLIHLDNPGFGEAFIAELMQAHQGVETLHILPQLPFSVDGTGHIDMWMYLIDDDTVIISEFIPGSNPTAITITENAVTYMEGLGYEVVRVPAMNAPHPYTSNCHYTYTNSYRVNDRIFIPSYGQGNPSFASYDQRALLAYKAAAPEAEIVQINSYDIIYAAGAIHCIMMQVPRYTESEPAAHVIAPDGGEVACAGTTYDLRWAATDDADIASVDLHRSSDGGATWVEVIATGLANDGRFAWTVPDAATTEAVVKVVAHDGDGNEADAVSENTFVITGAPQATYDFSSGAGVDKWGWGYRSVSWAALNGVRHPGVLSTQLSGSAYGKIASSDATGGDSDPNRYISSYPSSGYESTHVFEFLIDEYPGWMLDVGVLWEGYGDACAQVELYVWDHVAGNWCDTAGAFGENRFIDNFAGNRDKVLEGHIGGDFSRYIEPNGRLTLLLYAERSGQRTFHDYVAVVVTHAEAGDIDADGDRDMDDVALFVGVLLGDETGGGYTARSDVNQDGVADGTDVSAFVSGVLFE